ncbi:MAG: Rieske (2Fe-2S) protein, partial [Gammaproteobacteria bacterium]
MSSDNRIQVADLATLESRGVVTVAGEFRRIAVFSDGGQVYAVENNCPHMGFPLDKGSVRDGILTCHWHQARFDLRSGCTFDLWADDVPRYEVEVEDGMVYVAPTPTDAPGIAEHRARLMRGIEQNVPLVQAKSLLALLDMDASLASVLAPVVRFASHNLGAMSEGLIRLGCVSRLYPQLSRDTAYQALQYAVRTIAEETSRAVPRRERQALGVQTHDLDTLKRWLRQWVQTRHRDGAERTLLTGLHDLDPQQLAELVFMGATERLYAAGGHHLEDCNKAFELIEMVPELDGEVLLPLLVRSMTDSRGEEESTNWHHPIEIVAPMRDIERELPELLNGERDATWEAPVGFRQVLLGDDPLVILTALRDALAGGAAADRVAREVALAAASRLARFATSNEVTDWFNPQHTFIFTNAAYRAVQRSASPDVVRGVFQGAVSVYIDRFLNVPAARLPSERRVTDLPNEPDALLDGLLSELDQRASIDRAADLVAHYLACGHDFSSLVDRLTLATV